jgi:FixJ family two-component response regulator
MLGVSDYLRKPFAMDVMLESVQRALQKSEATGGTRSSEATGNDRLRRAVRKKAKKDEEE